MLAGHCGFELGDAVQQLWFFDFACGFHGCQNMQQFLFGAVEKRGQLPGHGQGQQRHHAVGIDFEETLHQSSGLAGVHAVIANQQAAKAIGVNAEIGIGATRTASNGGAYHGIAGKIILSGFHRVRSSAARDDRGMNGCQGFALQFAGPGKGHQRHCGL